jgi:hypothetical protein
VPSSWFMSLELAPRARITTECDNTVRCSAMEVRRQALV